jgi:rod shape-determining protein MreC
MRFIYTKNFRRVFAAFIAVALLIMADRLGYLGLVKTAAQKTFGSAAHGVGSGLGSAKGFLQIVGTLSGLARENAELNQRINELSFENSRLQSAKAENLALRRALNFQEEHRYETIPAEVIIMDPTGFSQTIVIDKGESDGVSLGESVMAAPGLLVGRVTKVYRNSAEVTLITDPSVTINGEVVDSAARGLVKGEHGISLILDLVTQNEVIKAGDRIITSGLSGDFPRGLLIGEINAIKSSSSDLFQQAFVTPVADLRNLKFLFVVQ